LDPARAWFGGAEFLTQTVYLLDMQPKYLEYTVNYTVQLSYYIDTF